MKQNIIKLFIVNAIEDAEYKKEIQKILKNITDTDSVEIKKDLLADENESDYMYESVQEANILLLLLSSDFFANDTLSAIADFACDLHHKNIKTVIPIVVRKFFSDINAKLALIPHLPTHGDIASSPDIDHSYREIGVYIKAIISLVETKLENYELKQRLAKYEKQ